MPGTSPAAARPTTSPQLSAPRTNAATTAAPTASETTGTRETTRDDSPYAATQRVRRGGRSSGHQSCARPTRTAGEPDQFCPAGTRPKTAEPGSTVAFRPILVPGISELRAPTELPAPIRISPMRTTSPSIQ